MLIVTGGAGFIGSNLVHELNAHGITDILVVDDLANATEAPQPAGRALCGLHGQAGVPPRDPGECAGGRADRGVLHQGACSNTLEDDGVYMMDNNFQYTKEVLVYAIAQGAPLVFASTAAVYGLSGPGHFTPCSRTSGR
jgi:ADP-L-glycero-D-manno-heptose 6-epimerase